MPILNPTDFQFVVKTADETVNNSASLQDDDELKFDVGANQKWCGLIFLRHNTGTTPDIKVDFSVPSGASVYTAHTNENSKSGGAVAILTGTGNNAYMMLSFLVVVSSTAGTVNMQWAQNTADASDTKVLAGSMLIIKRID